MMKRLQRSSLLKGKQEMHEPISELEQIKPWPSCGFHLQSGHIQEATNECMNNGTTN